MTAKEMYDKILIENDQATSTEMMIEFAKYHCTEQVRVISDNATASLCGLGAYWAEVDDDSILNAYKLTNIK
jgi:hypothetical protein